MNGHQTPRECRVKSPKKLLFIDNFIKGWGYFVIVGLLFGFLAVRGSLWNIAKFNIIIWSVMAITTYFIGYNETLKWAIEKQGKSYSRARMETERFMRTFVLELAILFPMASITGATLFSIAYPNTLLGIILVAVSSIGWGYIHAKIFTPVYTPIEDHRKVFRISKVVYQKVYDGK